jgi:uncharacterized protein YbjT (DUF2867 family)
MTPTVLVTGATGNIGHHVVTGLRDRGAAVRALTRRPVMAAASLPPQVQVVAGDLTDAGSLADALDGVDGVFLLWPFLTPDGVDAVAAAIAKHARHVVYVSALNVTDDGDPATRGVWGAVEDAVRRSGVGWTFLRASGFATNTLEWAPSIRMGEPVRIPYPRAARSLIHERDIADVAVRALTGDRHLGKAYVLTGPAALTMADQIEAIGTVVGKRTTVVEQPVDEARAQLATWTDPSFADSALRYWAGLVDEPEPVTRTVEEITGRPARAFAAWAADHADDFRVLSTAEVAQRYTAAFRAGRMDQAVRLYAPDVSRIAPIESGEQLRGLGPILTNAQRLNADYHLHAVDVAGPYLHEDQFAVRFAFDQTHIPTGHRSTSAKMSLYTVIDGAIAREEVFYLDPPPASSGP